MSREDIVSWVCRLVLSKQVGGDDDAPGWIERRVFGF